MTDEERLIGAWSLVEMATVGPNGPLEPMWTDPVGTLLYTHDHRMAGTLGRRDLPRIDPAGEVTLDEAQAFVRGFIAYYGEWAVDEARSAVVHRVDYASYAPLFDGEQVRFYRFEKDCLILQPERTTGEPYTELVWRRT